MSASSVVAGQASQVRGEISGTRARRWATTVLGVLLLGEGLGKLAAPAGYLGALAQFRAIPESAVAIVGSIWMTLELACGAGLVAAGLAKSPSRAFALPAAIGALVLQLAYATLSTQAYVRGLHIANCTCFGYLPQTAPQLVRASAGTPT